MAHVHEFFLESLKNVVRSKVAVYLYNCDRSLDVNMLFPKQFDALIACYSKDCVCVLPTGYGKSLIYELLPYFHKVCSIEQGCTEKCVVILLTPLNSIIRQQVDALGSRCCRVSDVNKLLQSNSTFTRPVCLRLLADRLVNCDFMYVVGLPEDILTESMWPILKNQSWQECKSIVVVDEGHCVIQWKTFRPKYERISQLRALIPACKLLVLTATASVAMQASICTELMLVNPRFVVGSVDRTNIYIAVTRLSKNNMPVEDVFASCMEPIFVNLRQKRESFDKVVVYCKLHYVGLGYELATIEDLHDFVGQYHAHLPDETKAYTASEMQKPDGKIRLLFATEAYSMGTDAPNIRHIIHYGPPSTVEVYVQEMGRAGRDRQQAFATLFYQYSDISSNVKHVAKNMKDYCIATACRRQTLMTFFDQDPSYNGPDCMCCDICRASCKCSKCCE